MARSTANCPQQGKNSVLGHFYCTNEETPPFALIFLGKIIPAQISSKKNFLDGNGWGGEEKLRVIVRNCEKNEAHRESFVFSQRTRPKIPNLGKNSTFSLIISARKRKKLEMI